MKDTNDIEKLLEQIEIFQTAFESPLRRPAN